MEKNDLNSILARNILKYRKKAGLTQDALANRLGVTYQAVSKWENGFSAPDISVLPILADLLDCSIDALFSRGETDAPEGARPEVHYDLCTEFPWPDDDVFRGVVCEGRKILQQSKIAGRFTFEWHGDARNVECECNLEVHGNVEGDCEAGGTLTVEGDVAGDCDSGGFISVEGDVTGDCAATGTIAVEGDVIGNCTSGGMLTVEGDVIGACTSEGDLNVEGDVNGNCISRSSTVTVDGEDEK